MYSKKKKFQSLKIEFLVVSVLFFFGVCCTPVLKAKS
jgi:hypothetical protein